MDKLSEIRNNLPAPLQKCFSKEGAAIALGGALLGTAIGLAMVGALHLQVTNTCGSYILNQSPGVGSLYLLGGGVAGGLGLYTFYRLAAHKVNKHNENKVNWPEGVTRTLRVARTVALIAMVIGCAAAIAWGGAYLGTHTQVWKPWYGLSITALSLGTAGFISGSAETLRLMTRRQQEKSNNSSNRVDQL